jgi:predicted ABC-type ATPase
VTHLRKGRVKDLIVIGGPNGAGKTTAAPDVLPSSLGVREFINADEIARGLSPFNPDSTSIAAGRLMLERMQQLAEVGESFAIETTCSGRAHPRFLRNCKNAGYRLTLVFLWLPSVDVALARVARRVREGGHSIPDDVVARRYVLGLRNMRQIYLPLVDIAVIYDNSDHGRVLIAERRPGAELTVHDPARWQQIVEAAT